MDSLIRFSVITLRGQSRRRLSGVGIPQEHTLLQNLFDRIVPIFLFPRHGNPRSIYD